MAHHPGGRAGSSPGGRSGLAVFSQCFPCLLRTAFVPGAVTLASGGKRQVRTLAQAAFRFPLGGASPIRGPFAACEKGGTCRTSGQFWPVAKRGNAGGLSAWPCQLTWLIRDCQSPLSIDRTPPHPIGGQIIPWPVPLIARKIGKGVSCPPSRRAGVGFRVPQGSRVPFCGAQNRRRADRGGARGAGASDRPGKCFKGVYSGPRCSGAGLPFRCRVCPPWPVLSRPPPLKDTAALRRRSRCGCNVKSSG